MVAQGGNIEQEDELSDNEELTPEDSAIFASARENNDDDDIELEEVKEATNSGSVLHISNDVQGNIDDDRNGTFAKNENQKF